MRVLVLAVAGLVYCASGPLKAGEITVLGHPEVEAGLAAAAAAFEKETGDKLTIAYMPTPEIRKRLHAGDAIDLVIASAAAIAEFTKFGKVDKEAVRLGQVGAGIAIRPTALVPAIASSEATAQPNADDATQEEVISALLNLGCTRDAARKAVGKALKEKSAEDILEFESLFRRSLDLMSR